MKILLIHGGENSCPGGVNKTVSKTAKNLSLMGHEIVLIQENPFNRSEKDFIDGYKVIRIKSRFGKYLYGFSFEMLLKFKNLYLDFKPQIVHIHGYHTLLTIEIVHLIKKIDPKVPLVFSPHFGQYSHSSLGGKYLWNAYNRFVGKKLFKYSDLIITASDYEANSVIKVFKGYNINLNIIGHGVDVINTEKKKFDDGTIYLLYVGYLLKLKGIQYVMKAMKKLIQDGKNVFLNIIGEGSYEKQLRDLANDLKMNNHIAWHKFLDSNQLIDYYRKSDVLLLLSMSENYGIVVSESLALGTPVIVAETTSLKEFLSEPGCYGVDYPPNPEKVANLILKIYENKITVGSLTNKIRTWEEVSVEYEKIYFNLLNG